MEKIISTGLQKVIPLFFLLFLFSFYACGQDHEADIGNEIEHSLQEEVLEVWYPKSVDRQHGGFLSTFTYDWEPTDPQDKMIVTQARHVWSNAKASQLHPDIAHYRQSAEQGVKFLEDVMWDKNYGGFYTLTDREGDVKSHPNEEKTAYGNSFGIYALAAYYQTTGDEAALDLARKTFLWLEEHSHDPENGGYFQHMTRDGTPYSRSKIIPSTSDVGYKDQNSSIHLLEAFTELYQVWPDSLLKVRLQEMLHIVRDTITTDKGYLVLFFKPDWTPVTFADSSVEVIYQHLPLEHVSFGHDVETAYLMLEASHVLGVENDTTTLKVARKMVEHALKNGWDEEEGGFYDAGYYFKGDDELTIVKDTKNWWAQAEGLNTLLLMEGLFPEDELNYGEKFRQLWSYIQTYLIDHEHGGWYEGGLDKQPAMRTALKGHIWKASYHTFRALSNTLARLRPDTTAPSVPENVNLQTSEENTLLSWETASDDQGLLGYDVYRNGEKIGFTPLNTFSLKEADLLKDSTFSVKAVDRQGNYSEPSAQVVF